MEIAGGFRAGTRRERLRTLERLRDLKVRISRNALFFTLRSRFHYLERADELLVKADSKSQKTAELFGEGENSSRFSIPFLSLFPLTCDS